MLAIQRDRIDSILSELTHHSDDFFVTSVNITPSMLSLVLVTGIFHSTVPFPSGTKSFMNRLTVFARAIAGWEAPFVHWHNVPSRSRTRTSFS